MVRANQNTRVHAKIGGNPRGNRSKRLDAVIVEVLILGGGWGLVFETPAPRSVTRVSKTRLQELSCCYV